MKIAILLLVSWSVFFLGSTTKKSNTASADGFMYYYNWATYKKNSYDKNGVAIYSKIASVKKQTTSDGNKAEMTKVEEKWLNYVKRKYPSATNISTEWYPDELEARGILSDQRQSFMANNYELKSVDDSEWKK